MQTQEEKNQENQKNQEQQKETIDIDVSEIRERAINEAKGHHNWKQRGNEVYCTSCQYPHGFFVEPGVVLVDVKDGEPVFKRLEKSS